MLFSNKTPDSLFMPAINATKNFRRPGTATPLMRKTYYYSRTYIMSQLGESAVGMNRSV